MKMEMREQGFMLVPETDFEEEWINFLFKHNPDVKARVKCGSTPAQTVGLVIDWVDPKKGE